MGSLIRPGPLIVQLGAVPCPTMPWLMKMSNQKHDLMSGLGLGCQDQSQSHRSPGTLTTGTDQADVLGTKKQMSSAYPDVWYFYTVFGKLQICLYRVSYKSHLYPILLHL